MIRRKITLWLALILSGNCDAAIVYPKAPDRGRQIVYKNLDLKFLGVSRIEDLAIVAPHRGYVVGLTNLVAGNMLSAAKPYCWRYPLSQGTNGVGVAVLNADAKSGKARGFESLEKSGFATETVEALRIAEQLPQIKKQDYELRYLNIPAVSFVAAWLHGESDDIIIPLPPTFGGLNANQPYSESRIISLLKASAQTAMKWDETIKGNIKEPEMFMCVDYLFAMGQKFMCHFTLEYRGYALTGKSSVFNSMVTNDANVTTIPLLVAKLRRDLPGFNVAQNSKNPKIVHIIEQALAEKDYVLNKRTSLRYSGNLVGCVVKDEAGRNLVKGNGLVVAVAEKVGVVLDGTEEAGSQGAFNDCVTVVAVNASNATVRSILTDCIPLGGYKTILWRAVTTKAEGKPEVLVQFYGPKK